MTQIYILAKDSTFSYTKQAYSKFSGNLKMSKHDRYYTKLLKYCKMTKILKQNSIYCVLSFMQFVKKGYICDAYDKSRQTQYLALKITNGRHNLFIFKTPA